MATGNPVAPVVRALQLLATLNLKPASSLGELHTATGLPKPTLLRLLDTLIAAGYATRIPTGYRITEQVLALSSGLRFIDRMVDAAVPAMSQFTRDHAWPIGLAKVRDGVVALLHSTAPESPLLFDRVSYAMNYRLMYTAIGQAHLAFCAGEERRRLILRAASRSRTRPIRLARCSRHRGASRRYPAPRLCGDADGKSHQDDGNCHSRAPGPRDTCHPGDAFSDLGDDAGRSGGTIHGTAIRDRARHCEGARRAGQSGLRRART